MEESHFQPSSDLSPSWPPSSDRKFLGGLSRELSDISAFDQRHPNLPSRTFDDSAYNPRSPYDSGPLGPIGPVGNGERNQPYQAPIGHGRNRTGTPSGAGFGPIGPGPIGQPPSFNMPRVRVHSLWLGIGR